MIDHLDFYVGCRVSQQAVLSGKDHPSTNSPAPVHEAVVLRVNRQQEQDVELKENVDYM